MAAAQDTGTVLRIESFGVRVDIHVEDSELMSSVMALLPPGWREVAEADSFADAKFALTSEGDWRWVVHDGAKSVSRPVDLDVALAFLEWRIRGSVAVWAPERIFVHAGAVAHKGRALLVPGLSFSGKSTLVAALVRAGAVYLSDEFAVLDADGLVHPYPKPLSLRPPSGEPTQEVTAEEIGGTTGSGPLPVAAVAVTTYVPGARWDPSPVSAGEAALALMSHAVPAQERPAETLRAVRRVAEGATCVRGERGEAEAVVSELLALLQAA